MLLQLLVVVVADDETQLCLFGRPADPHRVDKALAAFGRLRRQPIAWERRDEISRELEAVDELPFRGSRVGSTAVDGDQDLLRRERLVLERTEAGAVKRVGEVRAELVEVEMDRATTHLLVDRETDTHRSACQLRMLREPRDRRHDLGDARLVVGAEKRCPVARDDVVTHPCR